MFDLNDQLTFCEIRIPQIVNTVFEFSNFLSFCYKNRTEPILKSCVTSVSSVYSRKDCSVYSFSMVRLSLHWEQKFCLCEFTQ